ncbi:MAG: Ig-like domain-containing protein, partial [Candidatus Ornithomonoglobus sp.]
GIVFAEHVYSANTYAGGLIGYSKGAVSDLYSDCAVPRGGYSGGLIGYSSAAVSDCYATGNVGGYNAGGLVGYSYGCSIKKCYATGNIATLSFSYGGNAAGGLVGYMYAGSVRLSYATGNVEPYTNDEGTTYKFKYGGGLVGYAYSYYDNLIIENCYAAGSAEATSNAGGLIGYCYRYVTSYAINITNCYSFGLTYASTTGGLIGGSGGYADSGSKPTVTSCYYDSQTSGCTDTGNGSPKTTSGMKNQLIYDGWDFENIWAIDESELINDGYPYLQWAFNSSVKLTGITLDRTNAEIKMGETLTLTPTLEGENVEDIPLTWTSSDKEIASVNTNGVVTGKNMGTAAITVSCGSIKASCKVTVLDSTVKVTSVTLDKSDAGIVVNETVQLTASVLPEDATNKDITWTSTNTNIASVSSSGLVTGVAEGTAQIRAVSDSNSACYAVCDVTVAKQKIPVTGIEMNASPFGTPFEVNIGRTLILSPTVKPENATNKTIIWTSNDESIAKVANGVVTGVFEGTTTITATTADGGYSASCTVKVTKPTVYVTGIVINAEQLTVNVKETKKLTAAVTPADATDKTISFKSNNNAIASVSDDGTVTGVSPGTTLIQAISDTSSGKFIAFCTVTVPKPVVEVTSVKLDKSAVEIVEGKTVPVKAVIKPTNATYKNITWSTSDESIATVSQDGYITAQGVGEAVVSATAVNGVNTVCSVTVLSSDTPAQLKVEDATVKAGKQVAITVSIAANPGISTFNFDLTYDNTKLYPVSYTKGDVLENVNVVTPLGSMSFKDKTSVRFLCSTADSKNMDSDGDLITVVFQTLSGIEYGEETIGIVPAAFTNQNYESINLQEDNCTLNITDYIIGDVNNDDTVDLKDSMILGQYIAGFGVELTPQGRKAAVSIYPDAGDDIETAEPSINDFQHLFRYLSDWQVELGKK